MSRMTKPPDRLLQLGFVALLAGGIVLWAQQRKPRDLPLAIDLSSALPGGIVEVDLVVRRAGHLLLRKDVRSGAEGAPGTLRAVVRAAPGEADVEVTLVYATGPAHRTAARVQLAEKVTAAVSAQ